MIDTELLPKIEAFHEFELSKVYKIPSVFGCYVISNFNREIMYIGKAVNLQKRMKEHFFSTEKNRLTKMGKVYWFSYKICKDEFEISKLERGWLNSFEIKKGVLPVFNKIHA